MLKWRTMGYGSNSCRSVGCGTIAMGQKSSTATAPSIFLTHQCQHRLHGEEKFLSRMRQVKTCGYRPATNFYKQFYAAMKSLGQYDLWTRHQKRIWFLKSIANTSGSVSVTNGSGGTRSSPQLRISIRDPKSNVLLWTLREEIAAPY